MSLASLANDAKDLCCCCNTLINISESPSTMILWKPSSKANSIALLAASASTSMTDGGNGTSCDREAITSPSWLRMTTPKPTLFSFSMLALSKLSLYPFEVGGDHSLPVRDRAFKDEVSEGNVSGNWCLACSNSLSRGTACFPSRKLFRRFQRAQVTEENNSGSLFLRR